MCWTQSIEARWGTVGERFSPFVSVFTTFLAQPIGQVSEFLAQGRTVVVAMIGPAALLYSRFHVR